MMHSISDILDIQDDNASGVGFGAKSYTAATYNGAAIDMTKYEGGCAFVVSADTVATSLDFKIQESVDTTSGNFGDLNPAVAITQLTAAGFAILSFRTRTPTKRYVRGVLITGGTCVAAAIFIGQKRAL